MEEAEAAQVTSAGPADEHPVQLERVTKLRDAGALSEEEFQAARVGAPIAPLREKPVRTTRFSPAVTVASGEREVWSRRRHDLLERRRRSPAAIGNGLFSRLRVLLGGTR
jgi:hypothetical protein